MLLHLARLDFSPECTIGRLSVDGVERFWTLEDVVRTGPKLYGQTAIPAGRYGVEITWSPRFKCQMPLLIAVPGFSGVRIHAGNKAADTEGCILVGMGRAPNMITQSRVAYEALFADLSAAQARGEALQIEISP